MLRPSLPLSLLLLIFQHVPSAKAEAAGEENPECRLWLAPSYLTSDEKTVYGLYAGAQGFKKGEIIPSHEIAIPIYDYLKTPSATRSDGNRQVVQFLERNTWVSDYAGSQFESNHSTSAFIPGVGTFCNYHSGHYNVDWYQPSILKRKADDFDKHIRGKPHPSRGAISNYGNATIIATEDIAPGMELFANSADYEADLDVYQEHITLHDYRTADKVVDRIVKFMETNAVSDKLKGDVLEFMLGKILDGIDGKHAKIIRSLIPDHPDKLKDVQKAGGTFMYRNYDIIQSMEWLDQRGLCVDNLEVKRSTIPDAGRGAFARRRVAKGDIISPVPLMPIVYEEVLEVYNETNQVPLTGHDGKKEWEFDTTKPPSGHQVLYNYAIGHVESNLVLLPVAPLVNYINHGSEEEINAELVWSTHDYIFNDHKLHDTMLRRWDLNEYQTNIVMMLVATKDIEIGDEILMDYGADWQDEYDAYKARNDEQNYDKWPLRAIDLRDMYTDKPYPFDIQPNQAPYPPGVSTACLIESTNDFPDGQPRRNANGQRILQFKGPVDGKNYHGRNLAICDLIDRQEVDGSFAYTVITRMASEHSMHGRVEVHGVPQSCVSLVDKPYTSDIHNTDAFRHWINMDDQKFPQDWRNVRE